MPMSLEDDRNDYTVYGGRVAARWQISPEWESTLSLIGQCGESEGAWESDPALGDYKITALLSTSFATTTGTRHRSTSRATSASPNCR